MQLRSTASEVVLCLVCIVVTSIFVSSNTLALFRCSGTEELDIGGVDSNVFCDCDDSWFAGVLFLPDFAACC